MSFRPQFPFPTPEGYQDEEFTQSFSSLTVAALSAALGLGEESTGIPLALEPNTAYLVRGIEVSTSSSDPIGVRFADPWGNFLSDGYVPAGGYSGQQLAPVGACPVIFEGEISCPPGGIFTVDLKNLS